MSVNCSIISIIITQRTAQVHGYVSQVSACKLTVWVRCLVGDLLARQIAICRSACQDCNLQISLKLVLNH